MRKLERVMCSYRVFGMCAKRRLYGCIVVLTEFYEAVTWNQKKIY